MKTNKTKTSFGKDWTHGELSFPKHLSPEDYSHGFVYS